MSIYQVTMFSAKCDNCQEDFEANDTGYCAFVDKERCRDEVVNNSEWYEDSENGKHYCEKCWSHDDEDNLVLNKDRYKEPSVYSRDECVFKYCPSPEICKGNDACCNK